MGTLQITYNDILTLLSIIAVALLIVILYHLIFVSTSLRRTAERVDQLSEDIESMILKPLGTVDYMIDWFIAMVESMKGGKKKK